MYSGWLRLIFVLYAPLAVYYTTGAGTLAEAALGAGTLAEAALVPPVTSCAHIIPESPIVALDSQLTAYCILNETCISYFDQDASGIYWKIKHLKIPKEQYAAINKTVSSVTLNATSLDGFLTCNILASGQIEQTLYGIFLTLGLPPDKPENLTCIVYQDKMLTCTWNPGRQTFLSTNFTLRTRWAIGKPYNCYADIGNNSCTIREPGFQFFINTDISVEAVNALGKVESDHLVLDPIDIVKPNPPTLSPLMCTPELPNSIKIMWDNPFPVTFMNLKYNIRYRSSNSMEWNEVPREDTVAHRTSFTLQGLKPYTEYIVSLRCMKSDGKGFWSDWSTEKSVVTPETKPTKGPDLWREILDTGSEGNRSVHLKWKELELSDANGKVLNYTVIVKRMSRTIETINTNITSCNVSLTKNPHVLAVIAYNSAGGSPVSDLAVPATNSKELPPVKDIRAFPKDEQLWVEWTAPDASVKGYVIEWCQKSDIKACTIQWQKEPSTSHGAFLKGVVEERKLYSIKVYPLYKDGYGIEQSTEAYLKQGPPVKAPDIRTKKVEKYEATLVWNPIPLDDRNGFITNYTIIYRPGNGNESSVYVDPSMTEYTLSSLSGETLYMVRMKAYTSQGSTDGPTLTFTTLKFAKGEIESIIVPSCIGFLLFTLLGVIVCFSKRDLIKKHIWPSIPDPSKSTIVKMSPHTPTRHNCSTKKHPEESFTDVSVVEFTADDKSFSDPEMKPLDLLKKEISTSEGHSSGIGGSSCMSSPRQSVSDSEDSESAQTTSSTVQYSTVVLSGYRDQKPAPPTHSFTRSESTQPLLDLEEKPEEQPVVEGDHYKVQNNQYFKQNCSQEERNPDGSQREQSKQVLQPLKKGGHNHLQNSGQSSLPTGVLPMEEQHECASGNVVFAEGQVAANCEMLEANPTACGEPKSYLPQIVRKGGYMPQ